MTSAKLYVPVAVADPVHEKVQRKMAEKYGGFTQYDAQGGWVNDSGELIKEDVRVYEVVASSVVDGGDMYVFVLELARDVKELSDEKEVLAYVYAGENSEGETIRV